MFNKIAISAVQLLLSFGLLFLYGLIFKNVNDKDLFFSFLSLTGFLQIVYVGSFVTPIVPFVHKHNSTNVFLLKTSLILLIYICILTVIWFSFYPVISNIYSINVENNVNLIKNTFMIVLTLSITQFFVAWMSALILLRKGTIRSLVNMLIPQILSLFLISCYYFERGNLTSYDVFLTLVISYSSYLLYLSFRFRRVIIEGIGLISSKADISLKIFLKQGTVLLLLLLLARSNIFVQNSFVFGLGIGFSTVFFYFTYFVNIVLSIFVSPIMTLLYNSHCECWASNHRKRVLLFYRVFSNIIVLACFSCISLFYIVIKISIIYFKVDFHVESYIYLTSSFYVINILLVAILSRLLYISSRLRLANMIDLIANIFLISSLFFFNTILDLKLFMVISFVYSIILGVFTISVLMKIKYLSLDNFFQRLFNFIMIFCSNALLLIVSDLNVVIGLFLIVTVLVTIFKFYPVIRWTKHIILQLNAAK